MTSPNPRKNSPRARIVEERILLEKRRRAAARKDASRRKTVGVRFDSTREIRKMRDAR
jgi:hypothetical protein